MAAPWGVGGALTGRRRRVGVLVAVLALPALTGALLPLRSDVGLESALLLYLLLVVVVAVTGGTLPALGTAGAAFLLANQGFTEPYGEFTVAHHVDVIAIVTFLLVAIAVTVVVELAARARTAADRSELEAGVLSGLASAPVHDAALRDVLEQVRDSFGMTSVALLARGAEREVAVGAVGPPMAGPPVISADAGGGLRLVAEGPVLFAEDRRMLGRLAAAAARAWDNQRLAGEAASARELAEIDRLRAVLLAAVGHDLRTPLAAIKAAVSSLRQADVEWAPEHEAEFLAQIESGADRLDDLVANLLDLSRLQSGVLSVDLRPVAPEELVARALVDVPVDAVAVDVPENLPLVDADAGLLERVLANLVANARRFAPEGSPVQVRACAGAAGSVRFDVIDSGPGVPETDWERIFVPFQRRDDRGRDSAGVGLGLAIARGFTEAVGGTLVPTHTPGGGMTMTVTLPTAARAEAVRR